MNIRAGFKKSGLWPVDSTMPLLHGSVVPVAGAVPGHRTGVRIDANGLFNIEIASDKPQKARKKRSAVGMKSAGKRTSSPRKNTTSKTRGRCAKKKTTVSVRK